MDKFDESLLTKDDRSFLKSFMHKESCSLHGFRNLKVGYGVAQFANDKRGEQPPNAEFVIIHTANMPGVHPRNKELGMYLRAKRFIKKGEEITADYGFGYDEDYKQFKCKCKSKNCCGYIVRAESRWRINKKFSIGQQKTSK